jgi:hypothetical protein
VEETRKQSTLLTRLRRGWFGGISYGMRSPAEGQNTVSGWSGCRGVPLPTLVRLVETRERTTWSLTNVTPRSAFNHAPHPGHAKVKGAVSFPVNARQGGFEPYFFLQWAVPYYASQTRKSGLGTGGGA